MDNSGLGRGALAGFIATAPMTVTMEVLHRRLPGWERYPLPPIEIVNQLTKKAGLRKHVSKQQLFGLSLFSHFAYGSVIGTFFSLGVSKIALPALVKGLVFGLTVWLSSYLGLLPALGILNPATKHPARRNALMILSHLVWGMVLAEVDDWLQRFISPQEQDSIS